MGEIMDHDNGFGNDAFGSFLEDGNVNINMSTQPNLYIGPTSMGNPGQTEGEQFHHRNDIHESSSGSGIGSGSGRGGGGGVYGDVHSPAQAQAQAQIYTQNVAHLDAKNTSLFSTATDYLRLDHVGTDMHNSKKHVHYNYQSPSNKSSKSADSQPNSQSRSQQPHQVFPNQNMPSTTDSQSSGHHPSMVTSEQKQQQSLEGFFGSAETEGNDHNYNQQELHSLFTAFDHRSSSLTNDMQQQQQEQDTELRNSMGSSGHDFSSSSFRRRPGRPQTYIFDKPDAELTETERRLKSNILKRRLRQNKSYHRKKMQQVQLDGSGSGSGSGSAGKNNSGVVEDGNEAADELNSTASKLVSEESVPVPMVVSTHGGNPTGPEVFENLYIQEYVQTHQQQYPHQHQQQQSQPRHVATVPPAYASYHGVDSGAPIATADTAVNLNTEMGDSQNPLHFSSLFDSFPQNFPSLGETHNNENVNNSNLPNMNTAMPVHVASNNNNSTGANSSGAYEAHEHNEEDPDFGLDVDLSTPLRMFSLDAPGMNFTGVRSNQPFVSTPNVALSQATVLQTPNFENAAPVIGAADATQTMYPADGGGNDFMRIKSNDILPLPSIPFPENVDYRFLGSGYTSLVDVLAVEQEYSDNSGSNLGEEYNLNLEQPDYLDPSGHAPTTSPASHISASETLVAAGSIGLGPALGADDLSIPVTTGGPACHEVPASSSTITHSRGGTKRPAGKVEISATGTTAVSSTQSQQVSPMELENARHAFAALPLDSKRAILCFSLFMHCFDVQAATAVTGLESDSATMRVMEPLFQFDMLFMCKMGLLTPRLEVSGPVKMLLHTDMEIREVKDNADTLREAQIRFVDHFIQRLQALNNINIYKLGWVREHAIQAYDVDRHNFERMIEIASQLADPKFMLRSLAASPLVMRFCVGAKTRMKYFQQGLRLVENIKKARIADGEPSPFTSECEMRIARMELALGEAYLDMLMVKQAEAPMLRALAAYEPLLAQLESVGPVAVPAGGDPVSATYAAATAAAAAISGAPNPPAKLGDCLCPPGENPIRCIDAILSLLLVGNLRLVTKHVDQAHHFTIRALKILTISNLGKTTVAVNALANLISINISRGSVSKASILTSKVLEVLQCMKYDHMPIYADVLGLLGMIHIQLGSFAEAEQSFRKGLVIVKSWGSKKWFDIPVQHCLDLDLWLMKGLAFSLARQADPAHSEIVAGTAPMFPHRHGETLDHSDTEADFKRKESDMVMQEIKRSWASRGLGCDGDEFQCVTDIGIDSFGRWISHTRHIY